MTPSKTLFYFCISFIVGVSFQSLLRQVGPEYIENQSLYLATGFLVLGILIIITFFVFKKYHYVVLGFCILFLVLGLLRFGMSEFSIASDPLKQLNDNPDKITLTGQVSDDPDMGDSVQKLKVKIGTSIVLVTTSVYPEYRYLDTIKITGKLKTPAVFEDFNYQQYLLKDGIYSVMDYATVDLVSNNHQYSVISFVYEKILWLKHELIRSVNLQFSPPQNFIVQGVVYGNDKTMPQDLKEMFNVTGLSHVTAVSGGNVVILISMVAMLLLAVGFWKNQACYVSLVFVWFYIALVGLPPSAIRAGIMGSLMLISQILGRQNTSIRVITIAGAVMLLQNPLLLLYDIGFQLSFLASLGIIYCKPMLDYFFVSVLLLFGKIKSDAWNIFIKENVSFFLSIVSVTISAQLFALPIIIYNFGNVSVVSLVTNVLVLPLVPFIMVLGFFTSFLGLFWYFLGWIFSLPSWFLLTYFIKILTLFSKPWAILQIQNVSWVWLVVYYILLMFILVILKKFVMPKNVINK